MEVYCPYPDGAFLVSECENHRVMRWDPGWQVKQDGKLLIADSMDHRVLQWMPGAHEGVVVAGGAGEGEQMNELSGLRGLAMDRDGNLLVADTWNVMWLSLEGSEEDQIELLSVICRKHLGASASQ